MLMSREAYSIVLKFLPSDFCAIQCILIITPRNPSSIAFTYMHFLAAKSLCTKRLEERYSIPFDTLPYAVEKKLQVTTKNDFYLITIKVNAIWWVSFEGFY